MTARRAGAAKQAFGTVWLARRLRGLGLASGSGPLSVALSGGGDSAALLLAASGLRRRGAALRAIHINHELQPAAHAFAQYCTELCDRLRIPLTLVHAPVKVAPGESLEAAAREARYAAFAATLQPREALLLAQHADDQLETVLLQLLRGSGIAGLAAMSERASCGAGFVARPLLQTSRAALQDFLAARTVVPIEDPMNSDTRFDRSFLRLELLPKLAKRWPSAAQTVSRSARHAAEAQHLLNELGARDLAAAADGGALHVPALRALDPIRRRNALRVFISRAGLPLPDTARLHELAGPLIDARADAMPVVEWRDVVARRTVERLEIARRAPVHAPVPLVWDWKATRRLTVATVPGVLALEEDAHGPLDLESLSSELRVDWRHGGERLRPRRNGPMRTVKSLLQTAGVSPHERAQLPLVYDGGRLIAIADRWFDTSVQALPTSSHRGRLSWLVRARGDAGVC